MQQFNNPVSYYQLSYVLNRLTNFIMIYCDVWDINDILCNEISTISVKKGCVLNITFNMINQLISLLSKNQIMI